MISAQGCPKHEILSVGKDFVQSIERGFRRRALDPPRVVGIETARYDVRVYKFAIDPE